MGRLKYLFYLQGLAILLSSFHFPNDEVLNKIRKALATYYKNFPQEKIYLQFDKPNYLGAEHIWFKGLLTYQIKPSRFSKIVYVELFNDKGFIIKQLMLPVGTDGFSGEFQLSDKMEPGNYYVRAYTAWMSNFSNTCFFYKKISIISNNPEKSKKPDNYDFSLLFFPEGGELVQRLTSLVAFKAVNSKGNPIAVSGKIVNNYGETVALINSTATTGLGSFAIHSLPSIEYTAVVTSNGLTKRISLPPAQNSGIVLHVETKKNALYDSVFFNITRTSKDKEKYQNLILCAQMENHFSVSHIQFDEDAAGNPLDTILEAPCPLLLNRFGSGILYLSVFNQLGELLTDRLVFFHDSTPMVRRISMESMSLNNLSNEKNSLTFRLPDQFQGNILTSIIQTDSLTKMGEASKFEPNLFFASLISEYTDQPELFINGNPAETVNQIDLLLMTSKWTHFDWQKILNNEYPLIKYYPEQSISIRGHAYTKEGKEKAVLKNESIFLVMKSKSDSLTKLLQVFTDTLGAFMVSGLNFHDTADLYVQTGELVDNRVNQSISVEWEKNIFDSIRSNRFVVAPFLLNASYIKEQDSLLMTDSAWNKHGRTLKTITVRAVVKNHIDSLLEKYATGFFANPLAWAKTFDFTSDDIAKTLDENIIDYLNGKVAGLSYYYNNGEPLIYWRYSNLIMGLSAAEQIKLNAPAFFLNEQLLNVGNEGYDDAIRLLSGIRVADIAIIRVFQPGMNPLVPENGPHGSIAIYLKNGTEEQKPNTQVYFRKSSILGFNKMPSFDQNRDDKKKMDNQSSVPITLFWNPSLMVDTVTHQATISFGHMDSVKHYQVMAMGLSNDGSMVILNKIIE